MWRIKVRDGKENITPEQKACEGLVKNWVIQYATCHELQRVNFERYFLLSSKLIFVVKIKILDTHTVYIISLHHGLLAFGTLSPDINISSTDEIVFEFYFFILKSQCLLFPEEQN